MTNSIGKGATAFMAGIGFGAGLALLFAPRSGVRTRVLLAKKGRKASNYVKHQADALRSSAADLVQKGQEEMAHQQEEIQRAVEMGKQAYRESVG